MILPNDRVAVKICGLTQEADAHAAIAAGADALGFNTWPGTKRYIDLARSAEWIAPLPVIKVALLVNAPFEEAQRISQLPFIDALQLHGDEDADYCQRAALLGKPVIRALRANSEKDFVNADVFGTPHILLDAHVPGAFGGTGARLDLDLVGAFKSRHPALHLWLAGGLKPENVADAVRAARPRVVDVSSGVEAAPARKDPARMRDFVAAARSA
jgi:phosphoribosylanthranilate isomerase